MSDEQVHGRLVLWVLFLWVFLFLGMMYVRKPEKRESTVAAFPLFRGLASQVDTAAERLKWGEGNWSDFDWDVDSVETNPDS